MSSGAPYGRVVKARHLMWHAAIGVLVACVASLGAQNRPATPIQLSGHVVRPGTDAMEGVPGIWVTLHRVGRGNAGPVDSVRTSASGTYRLAFRPNDDTSAVYFASAMHHGIAYFSSPFKSDAPPPDDTEITVFDTTSKRIPITIQGRHIVVGAPNQDGDRQVTEVFELTNDSSVTYVAPSERAEDAVWSIGLPTRARDARVSDGDIPPDVVRFTKGRTLLFATFSPGLKQLAYTYVLPESAFPLTIPLESATPVVEVLLQEPAATAQGTRLRTVDPVVLNGRQFVRYLADSTVSTGVLTVLVPEAERPVRGWYLAGMTVLIGGAMLGALLYALKKKGA